VTGVGEMITMHWRHFMVTAPLTHENSLIAQGFPHIAGVDEAGRGALAGVVVACAAILPARLIIEGVNDSKKLSPKHREQLAAEIKKNALAYAFGIIDVGVIAEINILQASLLAMKKAVEGLATTPSAILIDGNKLPQGLPCPAYCIKQGDSASHTIAAASILAKVKRDAIMLELHEEYPMYGFDRHKGYGTVIHKTALKEHGLCPQHRESFCKL